MLLRSVRRLVKSLSRRPAAPDRPKRPAFRLRPWLEGLEDRTVPSTVNWIGGSGAWNDASHWLDAATLTNHVPTAIDDAVIGLAGVTVSHDTGSDTVHSLTIGANLNDAFVLSSGTLSLSSDSVIGSTDTFDLSGGTLTGSGNLTVSGPLSWSGGTMSGSGSTLAQGGLQLGTAQLRLDGRALANPGTAALGAGDLFVSNGATITNSGTWDFQGDGRVIGLGGAGAFVNQGTLQKSGGAGTSSIDVMLDSSGAVRVQSGTLTLSGVAATGSFDVSAGATLKFATSGTADNLNAGAVVSSAGTVTFGGGVTNFNAGSGLSATGPVAVIDGGTANFNAGSGFSATGPVAINGTADFRTGAGVTLSTLALSGTLTGSDAVTVSGLTTWSGGTMSGSGSTLAQGGLQLGPAQLRLDGRALANPGTAALGAGDLFVSNGATITNSGTWDFQGDGRVIGLGGAGAFVTGNAAEVRRRRRRVHRRHARQQRRGAGAERHPGPEQRRHRHRHLQRRGRDQPDLQRRHVRAAERGH